MPELVSQALDLVLYGMGSVFIFLTVLVGVTMLMSYLIGTDPTANEPGITSGSMDPKLLAAISAAVKRHRQNRQ
jgi:oxaloacetate decarboxylase gamma subunit